MAVLLLSLLPTGVCETVKRRAKRHQEQGGGWSAMSRGASRRNRTVLPHCQQARSAKKVFGQAFYKRLGGFQRAAPSGRFPQKVESPSVQRSLG